MSVYVYTLVKQRVMAVSSAGLTQPIQDISELQISPFLWAAELERRCMLYRDVLDQKRKMSVYEFCNFLRSGPN